MLLPIIHSIYIIYVLNYFKTKYSLAHPFTYFNSELLYHPIGKSDKPGSKVCKLGNILSWWLVGFIIIRGVLLYNNMFTKKIRTLSLLLLILAVLLSMLNLNVVLYLIPHFIIEKLFYI